MALLSTNTVEAATLTMYHPGGSPCNGACSYEWAVEEFNVPEGEPRRMMVEAGYIVRTMSYAKDGEPYIQHKSQILATDQFGEGYWFEQDGRRLLMFRLDECQNWAVLEPPIAPQPAAQSPARPESTSMFSTLVPPVIILPETPCCSFWDDSEPPYVPPISPPPNTPAIPLPATFWFLLSALTLLYVTLKRDK